MGPTFLGITRVGVSATQLLSLAKVRLGAQSLASLSPRLPSQFALQTPFFPAQISCVSNSLLPSVSQNMLANTNCTKKDKG